MEGEEAPEDVKLFTNMPSLGFSDCDDGPCAAKLTLTAEDLLADRVCELKMAKFNYVNVLSIFVDTCVEIKHSVGCTRQFFTKSFLGDDAAVLAPSSGEEPASPRHRAGVASMAWRSTRRFSTNAP